MRNYSQFFSCLYDEQTPIGDIGRGCHYSVFRVAEWLDVERRSMSIAQRHDFAVIWDEDHDTRVIEAAERLYMAGLLAPVQFIGERKGVMSVLVAARFWGSSSAGNFLAYRDAVQEQVSDVLGDYWNVEIGTYDWNQGSLQNRNPVGIIADGEAKVMTYLDNIHNLWTLGTYPYRPRPTPVEPDFSGLFQEA